MSKILIVEDELSLAEPLAFLLEKEGYQTKIVTDGLAAFPEFEKYNPNLILLDLMLPGMSGTAVCRQIRMVDQYVPIIMLTAKGDETDVVVGLELGADDYVTKPYSIKELIARIRALLRRETIPGAESDKITVGNVTMDSEKHVVTLAGSELQLPLKEYELLEFMMRNDGRVLTRSQIIDRIWGADYFGDTKTLDVHVKRLRSKIEDSAEAGLRIVTIRGLGYRLEAV
ncbi:MAG: response regulator transcription factor [Microbacteriaceae bacterium]|nr:response regulator transcription factor [Microbacteriaceae bacterium]